MSKSLSACSRLKRKTLFSAAAFISSLLVFSVQPMTGKMLLPAVGGAPSGWLVAMFFFQAALLLGYFFAHKLSRLPARTHGMVFLLALVAGVIFQPLNIPATLETAGNVPESLSVLWLLIKRLALPFISLSMSAPTLQRLFSSAENVPDDEDSYFMFVPSNLGGLVGLLSGPLIVDRFMGVKAQSTAWGLVYALLMFAVLLCLKNTGNCQPVPASETRASLKDKAYWTLLSFVPVSLMMGVTDLISSDIGAIPLFWIVPLAIYLLSFAAAFARRDNPAFLRKLTAPKTAIMALVAFMFLQNPASLHNGIGYAVVPMLAFGITALQFQLMLSDLRPKQGDMTAFYLCMSLGGLLGGAFNTFIVPLIFPLPLEFAAIGLASCWLRPSWAKTRRSVPFSSLAVKVLIALAAGLVIIHERILGLQAVPLLVAAEITLLVVMFKLRVNERVLTFVSIALVVFSLAMPNKPSLIELDRNFFGTVRVYSLKDGNEAYKILYNGSAVHSMEQTAPEFSVRPWITFGSAGSVENVFALKPFSSVAMIGLGAGTMLCYQGHAGFNHNFVAYEINPAMVNAAEKHFDYIRRCARPEIRIGDARRLLAAAVGEKYDLMVFDVFSSSSLPAHLITKEAFQLYLDRLNPDGVIVFHIYSGLYDLKAVIKAVTDDFGLHLLYKQAPIEKPEIIGNELTMDSSPWVAISRNKDVIAPLKKRGWSELESSGTKPWTDDYSDLISALK